MTRRIGNAIRDRVLAEVVNDTALVANACGAKRANIYVERGKGCPDKPHIRTTLLRDSRSLALIGNTSLLSGAHRRIGGFR
jgi:hypothetical protein